MGILPLFCLFCTIPIVLFVLVFLLLRQARRPTKPGSIAFYHPYCSSGGGGERVLWKIIQILSRFEVDVVIYTVDEETPTYRKDLLQHVNDRFSLPIPLDTMHLSFVHLPQYRHLLQPAGSFSMLVESIGTMRFAYQGLRRFTPSLYVDTTGAAFTFLPACLLYGCRVMAYVHYPTISTDMLQLVWERRRGTEQHSSSSLLRAYIKLVYYILFAFIYGAIGSFTTTQVLVNSTWTYRHMRSLWRWTRDMRIVYPPCSLAAAPPPWISSKREPVILSIGQFRPEKDHALQIQAMQRLLQQHPELSSSCRMVLLGSCRGAADTARLEDLQRMAASNSSKDNFVFVVNQPFSVVLEWLGRARVGIHTMWNEHFGIGIVELMAAGVLVVAHKSGGPLTDIVTTAKDQQTGYLASTVQEYADCLYEALTLPEKEASLMRDRAQLSAERFSDQVFETSILQALGDLHAIR